MADKYLNPEDLEEIKGYVDTEVAKKGDVKFTGNTAGATLEVDLRKDNNNYVNLQRSYNSGIEQLTLKARGSSTAMTTMKFYTADTVDSKINKKPWGIDVFNNSSTQNKTAIHLTSNPVEGQVGSNYAWFTETDNGMKVQASQMQDKELASIDYTDTQLATKQDKLTASTGIKIDAANNYISAEGVQMAVGVEKWYGTFTDTDGKTYPMYTKTIFIPALPSAAGITTYDHGISGIKQILGVFGFGTNGFVLNVPRQTTTDNIAIYQVSKSASNQTLSIEVGKNRSNMGAYVTLIYAKNN